MLVMSILRMVGTASPITSRGWGVLVILSNWACWGFLASGDRASHFLPARGGPFYSLSVYNAARFLSSANGCNEITISPYTTKKTKCPQKRHFVVFVGFVAFVIPLGGRGIVISLISLKSCFS